MAQAAPQTERILPAPGTWEIDPAHSSVEFVARHVLTKLRGRFTEFSGAVVVGERPEDAQVEVDIVAASIQTDTEDRDDHLRSPDFLDVERYPQLRFRSTALRPSGESTFELDGELTIRDVTRPVTLEAELVGLSRDPYGNELATFSASTEIDREAFGVTWNVAIETGGWLVGRTVGIELEIEVRRVAEA